MLAVLVSEDDGALGLCLPQILDRPTFASRGAKCTTAGTHVTDLMEAAIGCPDIDDPRSAVLQLDDLLILAIQFLYEPLL